MWKTVPGIVIIFGISLLIFWNAFLIPSPTVVFDLRRDRYSLKSHDAWDASSTVDASLLSSANPCVSPYAYACGNWTRPGEYMWDNIHHVFRRVALASVATIKWAPDKGDEPFSTTYQQCVREILTPPSLDKPAHRDALLSLLATAQIARTDVFAAIVALGERALFPLLDWHIENGTLNVHPSLWTRPWSADAIHGACRWLRRAISSAGSAGSAGSSTIVDPSCEDTTSKKHNVLMQVRDNKVSDLVAFDAALFHSITRGAFSEQMAAQNVTRLRVFSISKLQWLVKMLDAPDAAWATWLSVAVLLDVSQYSTTLLRAHDDASIATPYYALLTPDPLDDFRRSYPPWVHGWGPDALSAGVARSRPDADKARGAAEESCRWLMQELAPGVVGKYMRPSDNALALSRRIFDDVKNIIAKDIDRSNGLSAEWKTAARAIVRDMRLIIGFPYEGTPDIQQGAMLWQSALAWRAFHRQHDPAAQADWPGDYHPETVDAAYSPTSNAIYLPYALLHAPYLDVTAPSETHYARLGFLLGHEAGHALTPEAMYASSGLHKDYMVQNSFVNCFSKNYAGFVKETTSASILSTQKISTQSESLPDMMGVRWAWSACLENKACARKDAMRTFVQLFAQAFCSTRGAPGGTENDPHAHPSARVDTALAGAYDMAGRNLMQQAYGCDAATHCSIFRR